MRVLIFGIGAAGRAIFRNLSKNLHFTIIGFLENNEKLVGTKFENIEIYSPNSVENLDFDKIFLGGVWANDMRAQLLKFDISKEKIEILPEKEISFSTPNREIATDSAVKKLDKFLVEQGIDYFIDGSSLLCILRRKSLSVVSDVDIMVLKYEHLELLACKLPEIFKDLNVNVIKFDEDDVVRKAGDIFKIVVSDNEAEKMVLDINVYNEYGKCVVLGYNGKYFYIPKEMISEFIRYPYKDFELSIPKEFNSYLKLVYGKNYIEIPKNFSSKDYGNLVNKQKLNIICH
ncbi:hypothetical protein U5B43_08260 [Campylobacter sp. 9BO]|uniref:nucleoside-diphosphate sugar epimerase/dehydratase n=1 Tax=Campylobacter sp. 9BO TaxID=3424759 RepID=UPI003D3554E1